MAAFGVVVAALGAAATALPSWARALQIRARLAAESATGSPSQGQVRRRPPAPAPVLVAGALRSGSSLPVALGEAGHATSHPLGPELVGLANEAAQGRPMAAVLDRWTHDHDDRDTRLAATALALSAAVGATPARAVDGVAATVRERLDPAAERPALGSPARASAVVLSIAPAAFAVLLGVSDGAAARFLLRTPAGWLCLAVGLGVDAGGAWWMARLTRGAGP